MSQLAHLFLKFCLVGCINTLVGLSVIYLLMWLGVGYAWANGIGYLVGILVSFQLNKGWTFQQRGDDFRSFSKFIVVILVAYAANLLTVSICVEAAGFNEYISQITGIPVYTLLTFFGCRYFVFRVPMRKDEGGR